MSVKLDRCFVIMPFSKTSEIHTEEYWTDHYEIFLKPIIEECGLEAYRSKAMRGNLVKEIIQNLKNSLVVVADLTDNNPNVFFELGTRQTLRYGTVTIIEDGHNIPFDVSTKGTLKYYPKNHIKNPSFIQQFKEAIQDCIENPARPDSIVLDTLPPQNIDNVILHYDVLPVSYKNNKPRAGFLIINMSALAIRFKIKIIAYLDGKNVGLLPQTKRPYYTGGITWNLNAGRNVRGNFPLKPEWVKSTKTLILEVGITLFDENGIPYERLPSCHTYVRESNVWSLEPTSMDELSQFLYE